MERYRDTADFFYNLIELGPHLYIPGYVDGRRVFRGDAFTIIVGTWMNLHDDRRNREHSLTKDPIPRGETLCVVYVDPSATQDDAENYTSNLMGEPDFILARYCFNGIDGNDFLIQGRGTPLTMRLQTGVDVGVRPYRFDLDRYGITDQMLYVFKTLTLEDSTEALEGIRKDLEDRMKT